MLGNGFMPLAFSTPPPEHSHLSGRLRIEKSNETRQQHNAMEATLRDIAINKIKIWK